MENVYFVSKAELNARLAPLPPVRGGLHADQGGGRRRVGGWANGDGDGGSGVWRAQDPLLRVGDRPSLRVSGRRPVLPLPPGGILLGPGAHLPALPLQPAHALLTPLGTHPVKKN